MKKVLTIVGIVLVVVGIAFGVYMIKQGPSTVAPGVSSAPAGIPKGKPVETLASIIPADAELYLGVYNIGDGWDSLMKSAFWKELSSLQIWDQIAFKQTIETFQQEMQAQTSIAFNQDNIMELIGKQVAFALFMNNERQDTPSGLIVTKVGTKTRLLATLIELTEQGEAPYEKTDYKGVTVYLLKATEESPMDVAFAITKGNMAIEFGTKTENIKAVIDLILDKNAHKTLADNTDFRSVTDSDNGPHANQFYLNAKSILAALDAGKLPEALQDETIRTGIRATLGTVSLVGGSSKFFNGLYSRLIIVPNYDINNPTLKKLWRAEPQNSSAMAFIPKGAILFNSSHSLDIPSLWDVWQEGLITQNPQQANTVLTTISGVENNLGVSLKKDIFPLLGNEIAYTITDIEVEGIIPVPKVALFLKVKNASGANDLIAKIVEGVNRQMTATDPEAQIPLTLADATYKDQKLTNIKINAFPVPGLTPCFCTIGDQLILATNETTIHELIDVYKGTAESLVSSQKYSSVRNIIGEKNNQLSYIDLENTLTALVKVSSWLLDLQNAAGDFGDLTPETTALINDNVIPLINSFKFLKVLATNTIYKKEGIEKIIVYTTEGF